MAAALAASAAAGGDVVSAGDKESVAGPAAPDNKTGTTAEKKWAASLYGGMLNAKYLRKIFGFDNNYQGSYITAVALSRKVARLSRHFSIDIEGLFAQHAGKQRHQEIAAAAYLRLDNIPTPIIESVAVGDGFSYATAIPDIEAAEDKKTARFLNFLSIEATSPPLGGSDLSAFVRVHHRSGVFGLINGVKDVDSNFVCMGVRYKF
jgi:hypothetical protein